MKEIKFKDYKGYIIYDDKMFDESEFEDYYMEEFTQDSPKSIYGTKISYIIGLDLVDELRCRAQDNGYEEMEEQLDLNCPLLKEAQNLIDKWVEEQGGNGISYTEDYETKIDLSELYDRLIKFEFKDE